MSPTRGRDRNEGKITMALSMSLKSLINIEHSVEKEPIQTLTERACDTSKNIYPRINTD